MRPDEPDRRLRSAVHVGGIALACVRSCSAIRIQQGPHSLTVIQSIPYSTNTIMSRDDDDAAQRTLEHVISIPQVEVKDSELPSPGHGDDASRELAIALRR